MFRAPALLAFGSASSVSCSLPALLAFALALTGCEASPGAPQGDAQCLVDRDCQDGDLCNGLERCVRGQCLAGAAPPTCPAPRPGPCADLCADDEHCAGPGLCELTCLPPPLPVFGRLPVGARFVVPPMVEVFVAPASATTRPSEPAPLDASSGLTFTGPGRLRLEAFWKAEHAHDDCDRAFLATYEVVDRLDADPNSAPDAIPADDPRISGWAIGFLDLEPGSDLDPAWTDPTRALGPAQGTWDDALSLGNGGAITLVFDPPIVDGDGPDLAVFENGFSESFLELAFVEVSSDGVDFARFPTLSIQTAPVAAYGTLDPSEVLGLAGRFRAGFGTAFDLAHLADSPEVLTGRVDLSAIAFIRVVDLVGDGAARDAFGHPLYDPTPTIGPAGFDLEAIAALNQR